MSQYLGDLEAISCQEFYVNEKKAMTRIFGFKPRIQVRDKHPGYYSRNLGIEAEVQTVEIQHHKAHVATVIAEHNLVGPVLGFAFDGTGFGDDGSIWGSEVFVWDGKSMERVAHLMPVTLLGGDAGAKNCDSIMMAMVHSLGLDDKLDELVDGNLIYGVNSGALSIIRAAVDSGINNVTSSSMGRLFDAMSAFLGICHFNSYEGQAPIELENLAATTETYYPLEIGEDGDTRRLFEGAIKALKEEVPVAEIARGFIYAVADFVVAVAKKYDIRQVVLSGGTFLNRILLERVMTELETDEFDVYISNQLPAGDGSICLGQAYLADKCYINR